MSNFKTPFWTPATLDRVVTQLVPRWTMLRKQGTPKGESFAIAMAEIVKTFPAEHRLEGYTKVWFYHQKLSKRVEELFPGWEDDLPFYGGKRSGHAPAVKPVFAVKPVSALMGEKVNLDRNVEVLLNERAKIEEQIQAQVRLQVMSGEQFDFLTANIVRAVKETLPKAPQLASGISNGSSHDNRVSDLYLKGVILDAVAGMEARLNEKFGGLVTTVQHLVQRVDDLVLEVQTMPTTSAPAALTPPTPPTPPDIVQSKAERAAQDEVEAQVAGKTPKKKVFIFSTHPYPVKDQFPELDVTIEDKPNRITGRTYDLVVFMAAHNVQGSREVMVQKYGHHGFVATRGGMEALAEILEARLKVHRHH